MNDRRQRIAVSATSTAPPAAVFAILQNADRWPEWTMADRFELERPGDHDRLGVGAIRVFVSGPVRAREEVTALVADRRFDYRLLSGLPLRDYRASVGLAPSGEGGTHIRWSAEFGPHRLGTGMLWRLFMIFVLRHTARALATEAERKTISPPPRSTAGR